MAITQIIATLPAVLNDSETFYEDIAIRNNSLVTVSFPSVNTWATQANALAVEINDKAAQVAAQAVDGGYSQDYINDNFFRQNYINDNFIGVNNAQDITEVKTFIASPIVPAPTTGTQAVNKDYADLKVALASFVGANQSLSQNGYQKLPGGLIIQWGNSSVTGGAAGTTINLPVSFPTYAASMNISWQQGSQISGTDVAVFMGFFTSLSQYKAFTNQSLGTFGILWLAIGY